MEIQGLLALVSEFQDYNETKLNPGLGSIFQWEIGALVSLLLDFIVQSGQIEVCQKLIDGLSFCSC